MASNTEPWQAMKGPKMTILKQHEQFKQENQRYNLNKKRETLMNHINKRQPLIDKFLTWNRCTQMQRV